MRKQLMLKIENLQVTIHTKDKLLKGIDLSIDKGEIHVIMGKNGSGKSTLAKVIAGHPKYQIVEGKILFNQQDITYEEATKRSHKGIFLAFQYPVEIPGVNNIDFLRLAYNSNRKANQHSELDPLSFFELISTKSQTIQMQSNFLTRNVNEGFSGGEKKKNEILQMDLLNSKLAILDEIDSGLDIDALKNIAKQINQFKNKNNSILIITHYQRLLNYIIPDYIHIMDKGNIIYTGNSEIAHQLEKHGYKYLDHINKP
uniref:Iron-sulfur cluster formation ABC transporter ATP-binding subunit n=1 Tax=Gracilaria tikvahiae TaxID=2779 RepID=UPI001D12CF48|nr:Iron-sulfur cluster formation ABC transporter ATP-binding subunit [Gracilaria tikvahiae]UAD88010.1 Iron-sulfur cluster formation ABC transporter ATP-binding subunit [Gracilaria tikvahiae]UAD88213.1 Iron-sulfur cluster formation ABC transporter ATP-binding subunit [Gracilaria tikvahiae]